MQSRNLCRSHRTSTSSTTSVFTSLGFSSILTALTCSVTSSTGSVPLNLCRWQGHNKTGIFMAQWVLSTNDEVKSRLIIITHFALKELVVRNNQLFFLCRFGDVFDVSQQLVLVEKLKESSAVRRGVNWKTCAITLLHQSLTRSGHSYV